jgi:thioredoxin 1
MRIMNIRDKKKRAFRMDNKGLYIDLTETNFRHVVLGSKQPIMVEFGADWSGTCDIMYPILEELSINYAGRVAIGLVDADKNGNLAEEYGITFLPTFIFFKKGQVVDHIVGAAPKPVMTEKLDKLIRNNGDLK